MGSSLTRCLALGTGRWPATALCPWRMARSRTWEATEMHAWVEWAMVRRLLLQQIVSPCQKNQRERGAVLVGMGRQELQQRVSELHRASDSPLLRNDCQCTCYPYCCQAHFSLEVSRRRTGELTHGVGGVANADEMPSSERLLQKGRDVSERCQLRDGWRWSRRLADKMETRRRPKPGEIVTRGVQGG